MPQINPLAEMYYGWSPYNYVTGNPILMIDPTGMSGETTIVGLNDDGTYTVKDWIDDGKTDVITEDGIKIGNSMTTHSFVGDNGKAIEGVIINPKDFSGQSFFDNEIRNVGLIHYINNAKGREPLDFKTRGINERPINMSEDEYVYRGMFFNGKIASARDIGNYSAGYVAGSHGLAWESARFAFDALETQQSYGTFVTAMFYPFISVIEGQTTQKAERMGHDIGYYNFKQREIERQWKKAMDPMPTHTKD